MQCSQSGLGGLASETLWAKGGTFRLEVSVVVNAHQLVNRTDRRALRRLLRLRSRQRDAAALPDDKTILQVSLHGAR